METKLLKPKVVPAGEGPELQFPGEMMTGKLTAADTGEQFTVAELTVEPGFGPPPHVHQLEDEVFIIVEGQVDFWIDGASVTAKEGTTVFAPRNVPHTYKGSGATKSRFFVFATGDNFERFIVKWIDMLNNGEFSIERAAKIGGDHGITFLPPVEP